MKISERLKKLPPYLFAELDKLKSKVDNKILINLGIGDPDYPTFKYIVQRLKKEVENSENHHYPSYEGLYELRHEIAKWYKERFNVMLNPENEVLVLIGSKEGIGHIPLALLNSSDIGLVPDPGYPVYNSGVILAGGIPYRVPLLKENKFLPDLKKLHKKAKLLFLNYPNNPTAATASLDFFKEVVEFCSKNNIVVCNDLAYSEIYFENKPVSFLQVEGAKEIGIEFHSFSKTYNMTGWRIGFAVGNKNILKALGSVKSNLDSGIFQPIQYAAISALKFCPKYTENMRKIYKRRRDIFLNGLDELGFDYFFPEATFYIWIKIKKGYTSMEFTKKLLTEQGIMVTPGIGFGKYGEGYFRVALTVQESKLIETIERIKKIEF